jgi:aryl-alcohol dehydrogenase-like predicted oxidoreductase
LGKGFLTGKIDEATAFTSNDIRNTIPRFTPEARRANQALVDLLAEIGGRLGATPAQLALAWLLAREPWIAPIPGTTKSIRLEENIGATNLNLPAEDLAEIEAAAAGVRIEGDRYAPAMEAIAGAEAPTREGV